VIKNGKKEYIDYKTGGVKKARLGVAGAKKMLSRAKQETDKRSVKGSQKNKNNGQEGHTPRGVCFNLRSSQNYLEKDSVCGREGNKRNSWLPLTRGTQMVYEWNLGEGKKYRKKRKKMLKGVRPINEGLVLGKRGGGFLGTRVPVGPAVGGGVFVGEGSQRREGVSR